MNYPPTKLRILKCEKNWVVLSDNYSFLNFNKVSSSYRSFFFFSCIIFTAPTCTTTILTLVEPCALNAKFQHFIPGFNKNFLTLQIPLKEGNRRAERRPKDRVKTG